MDGSQVIDRLDLCEWEQVMPASRWLFQPDDLDAPDLFFPTEDQACAAQQGYRIARGFDPITGDKSSAAPAMLAALERLLETCALTLDDQEPGDIEAINAARAAVAAAKGGGA
jgi:hypothetical protein